MDFPVELVIFNVVTTIVPLILAIAVHEYAHIAMARFLGDTTGEAQGRFTLNPLAHVDPVWTFVVPVFFVVTQTLAGNRFAVPFFGAGKPAPYNPVRLDRKFGGKRIAMRTGELLVAIAGPASNLVLAVLSTALLFVLMRAGTDLSEPRSLGVLVYKFITLNLGLMLFNLLPVPPLDGSKVLMSLLPRPLAARYEAVGTQLSLLLMFVLVMGGARWVLGPVQRVLMHAVLSVVS